MNQEMNTLGMDQRDGGDEDSMGIAGAIWRRKWIVLMMVAVALGLGYLYFLRAEPLYQSAGQILLIEKEAKLPVAGVEGNLSQQSALSTHLFLLRTPMLVEQAVKTHKLDELPSLRDSGNPTAAVIAGLEVSRAGGRGMEDAKVVELRYSGPSPQDCAKVVDAMLDAYQKYLGETYQNLSEETVQLITQAKDVLHQQLLEKEAAYREFRQNSPLLWQGKEGMNLHASRMSQIEGARAALLVEVSQLDGRIKGIEAAIASGGSREALTLLVGSDDDVAAKAGSAMSPRNEFERDIFQMMLKEHELLQNFGPDHPKVQGLREKMDFVRQHLATIPLPETDNAKEPKDFLALYIESLRQERELAEERLKELDNLFQKEHDASKLLSDTEIKDETFRNDIARTQTMFETVMKRLEEINLVKDYGGVTGQVISRPSPGAQIQPKLHIIGVVAAVFGLILGIGLAYVIDISDRRFEGPDDVRRQLGLALYGHVPLLKKGRSSKPQGATALDPTLVAHFHPRGQEAEAYRAVRTSLYFDARGAKSQVIQITSPDLGDGKTTLAGNLAISIAGSGKRVVLLDGDFRRPRVHKIFGLESGTGLSDLLSGGAEIPDAAQQTAVENLWVVPCGSKPKKPADLLTSPRLKELFDVFREQYDYVLIDTPPLLPVTDASVVAPRVDGLLMVIRLGKHTRATASRALEVIESVGGSVLGVVVNAVAPKGTRGYRYGYRSGYRYGYKYGGYKSGYGYGGYGYGGYGYGYGTSSSYYADSDKNGDDHKETASAPDSSGRT